MLVQPERLADEASDQIAPHSVPGEAHCDSSSKPGVTMSVLSVMDSKERVANAATLLARAIEVAGGAELLGRLEAKPGCRGR